MRITTITTGNLKNHLGSAGVRVRGNGALVVGVRSDQCLRLAPAAAGRTRGDKSSPAPSYRYGICAPATSSPAVQMPAMPRQWRHPRPIRPLAFALLRTS